MKKIENKKLKIWSIIIQIVKKCYFIALHLHVSLHLYFLYDFFHRTKLQKFHSPTSIEIIIECL